MTVLSTLSDLPMASPLAGIIASSLTADEQAQAARERVGLGEITGRALLHIRGSDAEAVLQKSGLTIGDVAAENGLLARLRRDEFVLLTSDGRAALDRLTALIGSQHVTLTDITHGRCILLLVGTDAPRVLPKICALNFADQTFPNLHAAQANLAKVRTLIIRADSDATPAYGLIVDRSLAAYVWGVVFDAAHEFGGIALSSLDNLRKTSLW